MLRESLSSGVRLGSLVGVARNDGDLRCRAGSTEFAFHDRGPRVLRRPVPERGLRIYTGGLTMFVVVFAVLSNIA